MKEKLQKNDETAASERDAPAGAKSPSNTDVPEERGGPKGPEPTRFGDWESNGRCTDF